MKKTHSHTIGIVAMLLSALIIAAKWRRVEEPETFRGGSAPVNHPNLTPDQYADRMVELVEFLREKGIEPVREDFELPPAWVPPADWTPPEGWTPPAWWTVPE